MDQPDRSAAAASRPEDEVRGAGSAGGVGDCGDGGSLCDRCTALCCHYFALEIDEPESAADYDNVRWYLLHEQVHVFVEGGRWYLSIQNRCEQLQPDHRCGIYEDRPKICREYSTDNCDYHYQHTDYEQYFVEPEQLERYAAAVLGDAYLRYVREQRRRNTSGERARGAEVAAARQTRRLRASLVPRDPRRGRRPQPGTPLTIHQSDAT